MNISFGDYFKQNDKKLLSPNTGNKKHQTVGRLMSSGLTRKTGANLVARSATEKQHSHPKITLCLNSEKGITPLTNGEALDIMKIFGLYPNESEKDKAIKQTGVYIRYIAPQQYILIRKEKE
jgi:hypothetical protein